LRVTHIGVGADSFQAAVDAKTATAWVAAGRLVRISEVRQRVTAKIAVGASVDLVAVDPGKRAVWTTCTSGLCSLTEVSETTNKVIGQVSGLGTVSGIAIDPRRRLVWAATRDAAGHNVALAVSEVTDRVVRIIRLRLRSGQVLGGITADPASGTVWVSGIPCSTCSAHDNVAEISEAAHRVVHVYAAGRGISTSVITAVDSRRGIAWLAYGMFREPGGTIEVINIARQRVVATIHTAWVAPEGLAIDPRAHMVVATGGSTPGTPDSVVLLSESSGRQLARIPAVGFYPDMLAADPMTGDVYIPIAFSKTVAQFRI